MKLNYMLFISSVVYACDKEYHLRHHDRHLQKRDTSPVFPPILTQNEQVLASSFEYTSIASWSHYYTHKRNVAGESDAVPKWTAEQWAEYGFKTRLDSYHVYLNYPVHQSLELKYSNGSSYRPTLEEEVLEEDETTGDPDRVPAFHGYSFSGNATAEYVYVGKSIFSKPEYQSANQHMGRGQQEDFKRLLTLGIPLEGKIALAKYGGPFRGLKVKNAQEYGMIGVVTFTDPGDDKNMTANNYATYPDGPARNPTSIQKGSVGFLSTYPGDPTTPGYPSKEGVERMEKQTVPDIPSLPISWIEVKPILMALNGKGVNAGIVDRPNWIGAIDGVEYSTGPSTATLSLSNIMRDEITWIHNAVGIINGTNEDEVVIVGNHHDSWMIGGAADPHSGSSILVELAKAFGGLLETGWKPKRTIVLCSWDAEEYGLVGSTEWVEEYFPWLKKSAVSYLNIDVGVAGSVPDFSATPDLHALTASIARKIIWPHGADRTLYDAWEEKSGEIGALGAQSDYAAFVHRAGISSIDMGTTRAPDDPIYHTHSNFDSFHWMTKFADPGFVTHKAVGQYLTLMLYHLVDDESLPLEPWTYGTEMRVWLKELEEEVNSANATATLELTPLEEALVAFESSARQFKVQREMALSANDATRIRELNHKARDFSRGFVSQGGLPSREFYQNLVFAPGIDTGYAPVTFAGITESVAAGNLTLAQGFVNRTSKAVLEAAKILSVYLENE